MEIDPNLLVAAYAQIVGLLADFSSSRAKTKGKQEAIELKEFVDWLSTHGHHQIVSLIDRNQATSVSIKAALAEGTSAILSRISSLERQLAIASEGQGAFAILASSLAPNSKLSSQQLAILKEYEERQAGTAILHYLDSGPHLFFIDQQNGVRRGESMVPEDVRFVETDLDELAHLGLTSRSTNKQGDKVFRLTRQGHEIGKRLIV